MNSNEGITFSQLETINKLITALYNDDLSVHTRMVNFLYMFMDLIPFDRGSIFFFSKNTQGNYQKHSSVDVNWNDDYINRYDNYCCQIDDTLSFLDNDHQIFFKSSSFFNHKTRIKTKFWKEYLLPNNCIYSMEGNLQLDSSKGLRGCLCFFRGSKDNDFTDTELKISKLFQPHLSKLLENYGDELDSTSILFMLENHNCVGLCILDNTYQIIRANPKFKNLMDSTENEILKKCVINCQHLEKEKNNQRIVSSEYKLDQYPLFLEIQRLPHSLNDDKQKFSCLVYDLSYFLTLTLHQVKEKYVLSQRELQMITLILKGKTNEQISNELFLSVSTVKKYLASIYSKMEIKSQKQIFEKLKLI